MWDKSAKFCRYCNPQTPTGTAASARSCAVSFFFRLFCIYRTTVFSLTFGLGLYAEKCRTLLQKPPGGSSKSFQNGAQSRFCNGPSRHMAKKTQRSASLEGRTCFLHTPVQSKHVFLFSDFACKNIAKAFQNGTNNASNSYKNRAQNLSRK